MSNTLCYDQQSGIWCILSDLEIKYTKNRFNFERSDHSYTVL